MNTDTDKRRAYVEAIMNRLRRQYAERALIPAKADAEGETLTMDDACVHAVPDALQLERRDAVECAHGSTLQQPVAHPPHVHDHRTCARRGQLASKA